MNRTHTATAVVLLAATILSGCTNSQSPDEHDSSNFTAQQWNPGSVSPDVSDPIRTPPRAATALPKVAAPVDRADPDLVAIAALTIWFTWNTGADAGPNDAAARAAPLLTVNYAREITSTTAKSSPGAQWLRWAAAGSVLVPTITRDDEPTPPQTDEVANRAYRVSQTIDDVPVNQSVVAVILRRGTDGWEVSRIQNK
ncbi:hypothetical protein [Rhodococcoides yunnanense]|uniref:hypothetical protein n=1 Tax=Rhodococcoides yunnanense TaxID=278209 RepID=UPI000932306E|nr:hypothetical protein [Rhodococcus yunnanensis]